MQIGLFGELTGDVSYYHGEIGGRHDFGYVHGW